jgi:hypothetical protein
MWNALQHVALFAESNEPAPIIVLRESQSPGVTSPLSPTRSSICGRLLFRPFKRYARPDIGMMPIPPWLHLSEIRPDTKAGSGQFASDANGSCPQIPPRIPLPESAHRAVGSGLAGELRTSSRSGLCTKTTVPGRLHDDQQKRVYLF